MPKSPATTDGRSVRKPPSQHDVDSVRGSGTPVRRVSPRLAPRRTPQSGRVPCRGRRFCGRIGARSWQRISSRPRSGCFAEQRIGVRCCGRRQRRSSDRVRSWRGGARGSRPHESSERICHRMKITHRRLFQRLRQPSSVQGSTDRTLASEGGLVAADVEPGGRLLWVLIDVKTGRARRFDDEQLDQLLDLARRKQG